MCLYVSTVSVSCDRLVPCPCLSPNARWERLPHPATLSKISSLENGRMDITHLSAALFHLNIQYFIPLSPAQCFSK